MCDVSDIDDVIVFLKDGRYMVTRGYRTRLLWGMILSIARWIRGISERSIMIYRDGKGGFAH